MWKPLKGKWQIKNWNLKKSILLKELEIKNLKAEKVNSSENKDTKECLVECEELIKFDQSNNVVEVESKKKENRPPDVLEDFDNVKGVHAMWKES